jgi:cytoskeletal protein CcmA (bactofilin family)
MRFPFAKKHKMLPSEPQTFDSVIGAGMTLTQAGVIRLEGTLMVQGEVKASKLEGADDLMSALYVSGEVIVTDLDVDHIVVMPGGSLSAQTIKCSSIKVGADATLATDSLQYSTICFEPGSNVTAQLQKSPDMFPEVTREPLVIPQPTPDR